MKAAVLNKAEDLRIMDLEIPKANDGEIIMKVKSALTCGTDVKTFRRGHPTIPFGENKVAFGHEGSGVVYEVGQPLVILVIHVELVIIVCAIIYIK